MDQLIYTAGQSDQGPGGFGIRTSCLTQGAIDQRVIDAMSYPVSLVGPGFVPPVKRVWQKQVQGTSFLIRSVYLCTAHGGRGGNYFAHAVFNIPAQYTTHELVEALASDFWLESYEGGKQLARVPSLPSGQLAQPHEVTDWMQSPSKKRLFEVALALCQALENDVPYKRFFVPAEDECVWHLIQFLRYVLPPSFFNKLTFSTVEIRDGIACTILGFPAAQLHEMKRTHKSTTTANLIYPDEIWKELPSGAREYASWCVNRVAENHWDEITRVMAVSDSGQVAAPEQLQAVWKFCSAPETLGLHQIQPLVSNAKIYDEIRYDASFMTRILDLCTRSPLELGLLKQLHRQEIAVSKLETTVPDFTSVETRLITLAFYAAEQDDNDRFEELLRGIRSTVSANDNFEHMLAVQARYGSCVTQILRDVDHWWKTSLTSIRLGLNSRMSLIDGGWKWLGQQPAESVAKWLTVDNWNECELLLTLLGTIEFTEYRETLTIITVAQYLNHLSASLSGSERATYWLARCPIPILGKILLQVDAAQDNNLLAVWKHPTFRASDFIAENLTIPKDDQHSVYPLVRTRLLLPTLLGMVRDGSAEKLSAIRHVNADDILNLARQELRKECEQWNSYNSELIAGNLLQVVSRFSKNQCLSFLMELMGGVRSFATGAATWIFNKCSELGASESDLEVSLRLVSDATLDYLHRYSILQVRALATISRLSKNLTVSFGQNEELFTRVLELVHAEKFAESQSQARKQTKNRILGELRSEAPAYLLSHYKSLVCVAELANADSDFVPFLAEALRQLPEGDIIRALYQGPFIKLPRSLWSDQGSHTECLRMFLAKLLLAELGGCQLPDEYLQAMDRFAEANIDDLLSRRLTLRHFIYGGTRESYDLEQLVDCLKSDSFQFQKAFRKFIISQEERTISKLLTPFQRPDLEYRISFISDRFDLLYTFWDDKWSYSAMVSRILEVCGWHFENHCAVAAALFPFVRRNCLPLQDHVDLAAKLIDRMSSGVILSDPEKVLWKSLHQCLSELPEPHHQALFEDQLCRPAFSKLFSKTIFGMTRKPKR